MKHLRETPSQVGRNVELCQSPTEILTRSKFTAQGLREGKKTREKVQIRIVWKFVHVTYAAKVMKLETFKVSLEYVRDIQPYRD